MPIETLMSVVTSTLVGVGGGIVIAVSLVRWLGGISAARILENEKEARAREQELLIRRRNVYTKLATSMRVFLGSGSDPQGPELRRQFLAAYDEAVLWAPDPVLGCIARFLDMNQEPLIRTGMINQEALRAAFEECILMMRRDSGFPHTSLRYRFVTF